MVFMESYNIYFPALEHPELGIIPSNLHLGSSTNVSRATGETRRTSNNEKTKKQLLLGKEELVGPIDSSE